MVFLKDFDECANRALKEYPIYDRLVTLKVDGKQNQEIQEILEAEFNVHHTTEYISTLWRNKIPGLIASQAEDDYLDWYYREVEKVNINVAVDVVKLNQLIINIFLKIKLLEMASTQFAKMS